MASQSLSEDQKKIADKIIALLALASSTTFAAEAETARRLAEQLLQKHNIMLGPGKPSQDTIEMRDYVPFAKGMRWEGIIAGALAKLCSCNIYFNAKLLDEYALVGTIWNLDCLEYMLHEVNRQRIRAWLKYKGENGADRFNQFCYGFAKALEAKIEQVVNRDAYLKNHAALKLWYEAKFGKTSTLNLSMGAASSEAGLAAGKDASLHRGAVGAPHKQIGYQRKLPE
jgi:hypothetical protein